MLMILLSCQILFDGLQYMLNNIYEFGRKWRITFLPQKAQKSVAKHIQGRPKLTHDEIARGIQSPVKLTNVN